jgi:hypothetical protein
MKCASLRSELRNERATKSKSWRNAMENRIRVYLDKYDKLKDGRFAAHVEMDIFNSGKYRSVQFLDPDPSLFFTTKEAVRNRVLHLAEAWRDREMPDATLDPVSN